MIFRTKAMLSAKILCICATYIILTSNGVYSDVTSLKGEPDFRSVRLWWKANSNADPNDKSESSVFRITFCENQKWGKHRCRSKVVKNPEKAMLGRDAGDNSLGYEARLDGLRMSTNYTVEVVETNSEGIPKDNVKRGRALSQGLSIQTKGFYAQAINCLANSSSVEIETGPYFGGKISVEGSYSPECSVQGDFSSPNTSYILNIDHYKCGSEVRNTSVKTYLVVQENVPILTHSTRRFMIMCRYVPATFTVRAGVNLPAYDELEGQMVPVGKDVVEIDSSELFEHTNHLYNSREGRNIGRALKLSSKKEIEDSDEWPHTILMVTLIMAGVIGMSFAIFYFVFQSWKQNIHASNSAQNDSPSYENNADCSNTEISDSTERDETEFFGQIGPGFSLNLPQQHSSLVSLVNEQCCDNSINLTIDESMTSYPTNSEHMTNCNFGCYDENGQNRVLPTTLHDGQIISDTNNVTRCFTNDFESCEENGHAILTIPTAVHIGQLITDSELVECFMNAMEICDESGQDKLTKTSIHDGQLPTHSELTNSLTNIIETNEENGQVSSNLTTNQPDIPQTGFKSCISKTTEPIRSFK